MKRVSLYIGLILLTVLIIFIINSTCYPSVLFSKLGINVNLRGILFPTYRDRKTLCPEYANHPPITKKVSKSEIIFPEDGNLKIDDSITISYPHEEQTCTLAEITENYGKFNCQMHCLFVCSGKYQSTFSIEIPILKEMTIEEVLDSDYAPVYRKYFNHELKNCRLRRVK